MKNKSKRKQNWFKLKFKKHPYICFLIAWIISFALTYFFAEIYSIEILAVFFVSIFLSLPLVTIIYWIIKNEIKIKLFFIKRKKIFKPILYTLGGIGSIVGVWLIAIIISIGGVTNFVERTKFEYLVWKVESSHPLSYCSSGYGYGHSGSVIFRGHGKFSQFWFKEGTQYLDYYGKYEYLSAKEIKKADSFLPFYKGDPEIQLQLAINSKDDDLFNFNHCESTRFLLKAAHQGNKDAGKILASIPLPMMGNYMFDKSDHFFVFKDYYLFDRYDKKITEKDLDNPALIYKFAYNQKNTIYKKYMARAAEEGYLAAMNDITLDAFDKHDVSDCPLILKSNELLSKQKSLLASAAQMFASMGKISSGLSKAIYECSNKKTDFSKAISLFKEFKENSAKRDKPTTFSHTYPGIIYFNGWGNVKQDQKLAYELFSAYDDDSRNFASGYLAYMNYKGIVIEQNQNKGKGLTIELAKKIPITKTQEDSWGLTLLCGGINYNFIINDLENENQDQENGKQVKEYRNKLGQCLLESEHEVSIKFLEDYIFNRVSDFFKNPELVKTLNYLGEPK